MPSDGEDKASRSEDLQPFRELFESSAVGLAILSPSGGLLRTNPALQKMLGRSAEELRELGVAGITHPEDFGIDRSLFRELLDGARDSYQLDKRYVHRDGHVVWGRLTISVSRDARGHPRLITSAVVDVTNSKALEAKLAESERRYFELFDNALVAIFRTRVDTGQVIEANRRAAELVGLSESAKLVGHLTDSFYTRPDERRGLLDRFSAARGRPVEFEVPLRAVGGPIVWVQGVARMSSDGEHVDVVALDATERHRLEEERTASERRLGRIVETTPAAILLFDDKGRVALVNRAAEETLGRSREEIAGWAHDDPRWGLARPDGVPLGTDETPVASTRRAGKPLQDMQLSVVRSDGRRRSLSLNSALLPAPFGGVVVSFHDTTERRATEEALRRERQTLDNVIDLNPYGIALFDPEGHLQRWNRAYERMFASTPPPGYSLFTDPVGERAGVRLLLERVLRGETIDLPPAWYNPRWVDPRQPDIARFIHAIFFPTFDPEGRVARIVVMYEDATEKKRMEDALRRAVEGAEAADRAKTEFLSIASHELRTPLTPLRLLIQQSRRRLARGTPVPDQALAKMDRQVARLAELVTGLLDVSRLTRGVLTLERRRVDLGELVGEVVEDFRTQARERALRLALPARPTPVLADPTRIEQVLANLVDNALRYSPAESPVEVGVELQEGEVRVTIADRGPGVPEPLRRRLFTGVLVADVGPTRQAGLGLGLFLARSLVELHGGRIGYSPRPGGGSVFHFSLPLAGDGRAAGAEPPSPVPPP